MINRLKCDRQQPCKACIDRGLSLTCTFVPHVPSPARETRPHNVHDRIDQLEKLVTSLMNPNNADQRTNLASPSPLSSSGAQSSTDSNQPGLGTPETVRLESDATSYSSSTQIGRAHV